LDRNSGEYLFGVWKSKTPEANHMIMMKYRPLPAAISLICLIILCGPADAQHDGHREAMIEITSGQPEKAKQRLELLFEKPETLWRGERGPYSRVGDKLQAEGDGYRKLVEPETHYSMALLHSLQGDAEKSLKHARAAVEAGVPFERILAGPRDAFQALYQTEDFQKWAKEQSKLLLHGPMLGHVTEGAASFWVRTAEESEVTIRVESAGNPEVRSATGRTKKNADYTTVVRVEGLQPDSEHSYRVEIDGEEVEVATPKFKTYPPVGTAAKFQVAFTACAGYAPEHERVWNTIGNRNPLALLMLGDNVYIDDPEHALTQQFCYYRRYSRPEWRELVSGIGVYAIWDDHDFGKDDSFGGPKIDTPVWKREVWNVFTQNWNNPAYGGGEKQPGVWFDFHIGDTHFIMLDGRYYRKANERKGAKPADDETLSMLGPVQLAWLKETLKTSDATFKIISSPVPWADGTTPGRNRFDKWEGYPDERKEIFDFLSEQKINGVVLLSGDRHRSDARRIDRENGYALFDFMSAIPTNYHTHPLVKGPGYLFGHNSKNTFGMLHIDTTLEDPKLTFEIVTIDDESIWSYDLRLSELSH